MREESIESGESGKNGSNDGICASLKSGERICLEMAMKEDTIYSHHHDHHQQLAAQFHDSESRCRGHHDVVSAQSQYAQAAGLLLVDNVLISERV
jgi:hypothetical protein